MEWTADQINRNITIYEDQLARLRAINAELVRALEPLAGIADRATPPRGIPPAELGLWVQQTNRGSNYTLSLQHALDARAALLKAKEQT